jgi:hypothetical protein
MEKFQHNSNDNIEIVCDVCHSTECEKQPTFARNRTWLNANDMLKEKIGPDAQRIMDNMRKGSDNDFSDIYGDK